MNYPKQIRNWIQLKEFGILPLTGEACSYSQRLLCDLSEEGVQLMEDFLGVPGVPGLKDILPINWNLKVGEKDAIGSMLLHKDMLNSLIEFIAAHVLNCYGWAELDGTFFIFETPEQWAMIPAYSLEGANFYRNVAFKIEVAPSVSVGGRNVHQATGRIS